MTAKSVYATPILLLATIHFEGVHLCTALGHACRRHRHNMPHSMSTHRGDNVAR